MVVQETCRFHTFIKLYNAGKIKVRIPEIFELNEGHQ